MHDPSTVAFEIKSPFRGRPSKFWPKGYRNSIITIWHKDPERDGSDDSCGWFIRQRHLKQSDRDLAHRLIEDEFDNIRSWVTGHDQEEQIAHVAGIFAALRRRERPWWKHPRWHFWHWHFQVHPWQAFRRWAFSRCAGCGKGFQWGYSPITHSWDHTPPKLFRSEVGVYHHECSGMTMALHSETGQRDGIKILVVSQMTKTEIEDRIRLAEWKSIRSAPKNREIDVWFSEVGIGYRPNCRWSHSDKGFVWQGSIPGDGEWTICSMPNIRPTHWTEPMNLPFYT